MTSEPVILEQIFNSSIAVIWKAISDRKEMKKWYINVEKFEATPGFEFEFTSGPTPERQYRHLCKIVEVSPYKKISYTWRYDGFEGDSLVSFELVEDGHKTNVTLTHTGLETFPASNPDFVRTNFEGGWNHLLGVLLRDLVEKDQ